MDLGIIGFERSGKTTVFNAVTRGHAQTGTYGAGVQPNIGVVKVPDERVDKLAELFKPKKTTHADIRYVDFPGAAFSGSEGRGPSAQFLAQVERSAEIEGEFGSKFSGEHMAIAAISGKIEQELAQMSEGDAEEFRRDLGITESGLDRMIGMSYALTGLISFLTAGPDECRAWTVRAGSTAPVAAGKIHTDLEKGVIRAEVVRWDELLADGSVGEARKHGHLRQEGKTYVVQDGDVVNILFNV